MGFGRSCCKVFTVSLVPVTVFTLAFVFFCGIILLPALFTELAEKQQYGIVIDAGSTHTNIFLYSWKASLLNDSSQVKQVTSCRAPGSGISHYTNATKAGESIVSCTKVLLKNYVPKSYHDDVTVWFGATAGMRLLKIENESLTQDILREVRHVLSRKLKLKKHHIRILSGGEEGAAGWITANYLSKTLKKEYPKKRSLSSDRPSYGALDMGGASMQIAFEQQPSSTPTHKFTAELFNEEWNLYSRSYLCFGSVEAYRRSLAYLAMETEYESTIHNPCLRNGTEVSRSMGYLFSNQSCTQDLVPDMEYNSSEEVVFVGSSNPTKCLDLIQKSLNFSQCFVSDSGFVNCDEDKVPNVTEKNFLGFSTFYYTSRYFNITTLNAMNFEPNIQTFMDHCSSSVAKPETEISYRCFDVLYMTHVLQNGLGFKPKNGNWNISMTEQIDDIEVGWSLGYMLNLTYQLDLSPNYLSHPYTSTDLIVGMLVLTILSIVFLIFFAFTFSACRKALKPMSTGYTNIS